MGVKWGWGGIQGVWGEVGWDGECGLGWGVGGDGVVYEA